MFRDAHKIFSSLFLAGALLLAGCSNMPFVRKNQAPTRIFLTDFSTAWTATLDVVSANAGVQVNQNRETGIIEVSWIDNSESRSFLDIFSDEDFFLRMRYRLQLHVREGKKNGKPAVLVRIIRQQQKESTFLGGFQEVESDGLEESVYLYRIGRLIAVQQFNEEEQKESRILDDSDALF